MGPKIDDAAYKAGLKMFRKGTSLRQLVEKMQADQLQNVSEDVVASYQLGFADEDLDLLRGIKG